MEKVKKYDGSYVKDDVWPKIIWGIIISFIGIIFIFTCVIFLIAQWWNW